MTKFIIFHVKFNMDTLRITFMVYVVNQLNHSSTFNQGEKDKLLLYLIWLTDGPVVAFFRSVNGVTLVALPPCGTILKYAWN